MSKYTPKSHYKKEDLFDITKVGPVRDIDFKLSRAVYDIFNQKGMEHLPVFLGQIPYEFYIIPGMYLAIFQTLWLGTPNPVQFHLLPHWFAYSIFQLLKGSIKTYRPGCWIKGMGKFIDESLKEIPQNQLVKLSEVSNLKTRIGFLSADILGGHSITYFLKTVLLNYDKKKFEIILILNNPKEDQLTKNLTMD